MERKVVLCSWIQRQFCFHFILLNWYTASVKSLWKFQLLCVCAEIDKLILKFLWKCQGRRTIKTIMKKKVPNFKTYHQSRHCATGMRPDIHFIGKLQICLGWTKGIRIFLWHGQVEGLQWWVWAEAESLWIWVKFLARGQGYRVALPARCH